MLRNLTALSRELTLEDGGVPEWIELLPPGPAIEGRDGRRWLNDAPQAILADSELPLPLDWEHSTELRAPQGKASPAAGWIEELAIRAGSIWGRVVWNTAGQEAVSSRAYRFISPVFLFAQESRKVLRLVSAALTNRPNLHLQALNHEQENPKMDPRLLTALGLAADATMDQVTAALGTLQVKLGETELALATARNAQQNTPDMTLYVPMAQYEAVQGRAAQAETALSAHTTEQRETAISSALDAAIAAGKIAPATRGFYLASCTQEGGLERFTAFIEAAPKLVGDSGLDQCGTPNTGKGLTPEQKAMCISLGVSEEDYAKSLASTTAA